MPITEGKMLDTTAQVVAMVREALDHAIHLIDSHRRPVISNDLHALDRSLYGRAKILARLDLRHVRSFNVGTAIEAHFVALHCEGLDVIVDHLIGGGCPDSVVERCCFSEWHNGSDHTCRKFTYHLPFRLLNYYSLCFKYLLRAPKILSISVD